MDGIVLPPTPPRMHPLTLRFHPPEWERAFREDHVRGGLTLLRISIVVGGVLGIGLGLRSQRGALDPVAVILAAGPPLLLNGLQMWATFAPWFFRLSEWVLGAGLLGWGLIYALWVASQPDETTAIGALFAIVIVALYAFAIVRTGFVAGVLASLTAGIAIWIAVSAVGSLPPERGMLVGYAGAVWLLAALAGYFGERYARRGFVHERLLEAERARSEVLLLNVLPGPIAERLKKGESPIADVHEEVTALFADIVGFTPILARCEPTAIVECLNALFTEFDGLAAERGLEKIKTIGDCYMAVGGAPRARPDHLSAVADLALAMQRVMAGRAAPTGDPLRLRIGIDTGPAVAAVIGTAKFQYDLWGDVINTASRMEAHGLPDGIQVTEAVYERLRDHYSFERRGVVEIKGKGPLLVYLLTGQRDPVIAAASER